MKVITDFFQLIYKQVHIPIKVKFILKQYMALSEKYEYRLKN